MTVMRTAARALAGVLLLASATACSSGGCTGDAEQPQEVARPDVRQVDEGAANVLVDLSGARAEPLHVTVTFDEEVALDVEVPGTSAACGTDAVSRYGYRVDPGPVTVVVNTGDGEEERVEVRAGDRPRWVVVSLQEGFPLEATEWDERPAYG
jgi:hypothetical protein